ncbi:transcription termination/antitermination protein NusA [Alphaproteobacteria bacterium]|nr:transcription termination/antitermination protein NusA [Alphaproteobacteria bacterium]GHS95991.1 transcription termination/antitermination protein NusA [Alphaproteobacteria bacterium]
MTSRKIKVAEKESVRCPRPELLQVVEVVAREKGIEPEEAFAALESAIQRAAKTKYGLEHNIRVLVDRGTGEITLQRVITVVEEVENSMSEISLTDAKVWQPDAEIGFEFTEVLPPFDFGRAAAQGARQIITQKIREAEREHQYSEFIGRRGEIVSGIVKQAERHQVIVDVGRTEGILRYEDNIPRQIFHIGDRVKALLVDIRPESAGPMLILSRTHNDFLAKLFEQDITEIYDGLIKIMAVARDPGSRAKMAVYAPDNRVDPVGACVGMRGSRVQAVTAELQGEKIDIIPWSADPATYVMNALSLPEVKRVVIDEEEEKIDVVVEEEFLSQAIGRRAQNIRLASHLTGWKISIIPEAEDTARRTKESAAWISSLREYLGLDDMVARLFVAEGFHTVADIAESSVADFVSLEGIDEETAKDIHQRAVAFVESQEKKFFEKCESLNIQDDLLTLSNLDITAFNKIIDAGIRTRDDVADLSTDELLDILTEDLLPRHQADAVIMEARESWFQNEEPPAEEAVVS